MNRAFLFVGSSVQDEPTVIAVLTVGCPLTTEFTYGKVVGRQVLGIFRPTEPATVMTSYLL